jgi:photosystem II stability/assembly factor-like uncharacterized protein
MPSACHVSRRPLAGLAVLAIAAGCTGSAKKGFAVGNGLLQTTDGGQTWTQLGTQP